MLPLIQSWRQLSRRSTGVVVLLVAGCASISETPLPLAREKVLYNNEFENSRIINTNLVRDPSTIAPPPMPPMPPLLQAAHTAPRVGFGSPVALDNPQKAPAPAAAPQLSLDEVINLCLLADPKLHAGFEAINQAHANALTASLIPNPDILADVQLLPLTRPFTVSEQGGPPQLDLIFGFPIDWFIFGKRASAMASAALGVRAAEAEYADLMRRRVSEAAAAYFDVLEARELSELARQDIAELERIDAGARKKKGKNEASDLELSRIRLEISASHKALREADTALRLARSKLRTLVGHSELQVDVAGKLPAPTSADTMSTEDAYREALQNRPDIQMQHWKVAQTHADVDVENRKAYPTVKPSLGYTRQFQKKAIGFPDASSWSAWLEMPLPFFSRNQGDRAKAASVAAQTNFELQARQIELRAEVENATEELTAARANLDARDQLRLAEQICGAVNQAHQKGELGLIDVLDAHRSHRDIARAHVTSQASYWRSVYRFNAAIGKQVIR